MHDDLERLDRIIRETLPELDADGLNYGPLHYRYASGREGDAYRVSVAERKTGISLYVLATSTRRRCVTCSTRRDGCPRRARCERRRGLRSRLVKAYDQP